LVGQTAQGVVVGQEFQKGVHVVALSLEFPRHGVRKTHLAQALGYETIKMDLLVLYRSIFDLVREFMKDKAFNQQDKTLRRYLKPDLVITPAGIIPRPSNTFQPYPT
jgi:hypothetical protein